MNKDPHTLIPEAEHVNFKSYALGFLLSILLTVAAYVVVAKHLLFGWALIYCVAGFGVVQALIQLVCFLHLGKESKPRWNLIVFLFMLMVAAIVVIGSLFIMFSLNYRLMTM